MHSSYVAIIKSLFIRDALQCVQQQHRVSYYKNKLTALDTSFTYPMM